MGLKKIDMEIKTLTTETAIKNKMSPIDCVKYFRPDWTDDQCDYYLWEETCFPMNTDIWISQLNEQLR